ncbi:MAG: hypothetical protein JNG83_08440 [Opitutaceae bacterium]|nr:hypothetical protein [Opitutaceae bacterium]
MPLRSLLRPLLAACLLLPPFAPVPGRADPALTSAERRQLQQEARLVVELIQNFHFSGRAFREIENREMLDRYLGELDPYGDILTDGDVAFIHRRFDRTLKSVYLFRGDLQPAFEIFELFATRARERHDWIRRRLTRDIDLTADRTYEPPRDRAPPVRPAAGRSPDERWELRLADAQLGQILAGRTPGDARAYLTDWYDQWARSLATLDSFAIREHFFDAAIRSFDPHSGYFSGDSTREFAIDMENVVTGVGLDLRKEKGLCLVTGVRPGSPADLESDLAPGAIIEEVADGDQPWVSASAQRLRETVRLLRDPRGGKVRLAYREHADAPRKELTLERSRVVLADERAYGAVAQVPTAGGGTRRVGWIDLPRFYGTESGGCADDVRELLLAMEPARLDGLVLDLRDNPGGALKEAVGLSQLFLDAGVVMLSRGPNQPVTALAGTPGTPAYTGPLVILTSAGSASASEVFAGAMRQHRRAVVLGAATTFGKGTVQSYIELAKLPGVNAASVGEWGTLRLTMQRFYLPDGGAVQGRGVPSDIVLPASEEPGLRREADLPHALPPETVTPPSALPAVDAERFDARLVHLRAEAARHFRELPEWDLWQREQAARLAASPPGPRSLQLDVRQQELREQRAVYRQLRRTRLELSAAAVYADEPVELVAVRAAREAREQRLRGSARPLLHRLHRGAFIVESDRGHLRPLPLTSLRFRDHDADAPTLAAAFTEAGGPPLAEEAAAKLLVRCSLLERVTEAGLLAEARSAAGAAPEEQLRRGLEGLLRRMTELNPELRRERRALDIPLREGLRLAAAWADWEVATPRPAP